MSDFDRIFRQFKRDVEKERIIKEVKKREFYEKPSQIRRRKKARKHRPQSQYSRQRTYQTCKKENDE